jgi:hypothetical protein
MNQPMLPSDAGNDTDLQRIKARIRGERFVLFDSWRLLLWSVGIGAVSGALVGLWRSIAAMMKHAPGPGVSFPMEALVGVAIGNVTACVLIGGLAGLMLFFLVLGLISVFRPVYVALRYSPEEYERQYGERPTKIG